MQRRDGGQIGKSRNRGDRDEAKDGFERKGLKEECNNLPSSSSSHRHKHVLSHTYTHTQAEFTGVERGGSVLAVW